MTDRLPSPQPRWLGAWLPAPGWLQVVLALIVNLIIGAIVWRKTTPPASDPLEEP
jgi:hypothetical protein